MLIKRTNASLLFFLACLASCVPPPSLPPPSLPPPSLPPPSLPPPLAIERTSEQPQVRVTVELPATEDPASWDRKGAEELAKALQQTGQFEVATAVSSSSSVFAGLPPPGRFGRVLVMTATQNKAMDAASGGVSGYSADDAAAEAVTAELLRRGYRVIERQALNAVLREQGFQQSGMVNQATATRVGRLTGASAIIIVNVYNAGINYYQGSQGVTGNVWMDAAGRMMDPSGTVHRVGLTAKMIDPQTAEVVWLEDKSFQSRRGENTSHTQLLRDAVSSLSFPAASAVAVASQERLGPRTEPRAPPASPQAKPAMLVPADPEVRRAQGILRESADYADSAFLPLSDPEVRRAQGILRELGYDPGPIDGLLGKKARAALRQFQRDHHLPETGQLDAATKVALQQQALTSPASSASSPPEPESSPAY